MIIFTIIVNKLVNYGNSTSNSIIEKGVDAFSEHKLPYLQTARDMTVSSSRSLQ